MSKISYKTIIMSSPKNSSFCIVSHDMTWYPFSNIKCFILAQVTMDLNYTMEPLCS